MSPIDAEALFADGLGHLERWFYEYTDEHVARALDRFRSATALLPDDPRGWVALGFAADEAGIPTEALAALERATTLDPDDQDVEAYVLTLKAELAPEAEAVAAVEAAAERHGVDLAALRNELVAADMPTDARTLIRNGFVHARNFLRSRLQDEIDAMQRTADPAEWERGRRMVEDECARAQLELQRRVQRERVPEALRALTPWASRLGLGDAECRAGVLDGLTAVEWAALREAVTPHTHAIHGWLDGFGDGTLSDEAAAFLYLLLGLEERPAEPRTAPETTLPTDPPE